MEESNLFSSIFKYIETKSSTPQENYLTEIFAYSLKNDIFLFKQLMARVFGESEIDHIGLNYSVHTQIHYKDDKKSFFDMLIKVTYKGETTLIIFEHKYDSPIGADQIDKYIKIPAKNIKLHDHPEMIVKDKRIVYICKFSAINGLRKYKNDLIPINWSEIFSLASNSSDLIVKEFADYLLELEQGPVTPILNFENRLNTIHKNDMESMNDAKMHKYLLPYFSRFKDKYSNELNELLNQISNNEVILEEGKKIYSHYGKVGIETDQGPRYDPNIFLGIMYDGHDNGIFEMNSDKIFKQSVVKDFYVQISLDGEYSKKHPKSVLDKFMNFYKKNKTDKVDFYISDSFDKVLLRDVKHDFRVTRNKWRKLVIVSKFTSVVTSYDDADKQMEELFKFYEKWLKAIILEGIKL